ncbi:MAG: hypothetical protein Q9227_000223 [Pyrenula ochraceoflavens]
MSRPKSLPPRARHGISPSKGQESTAGSESLATNIATTQDSAPSWPLENDFLGASSKEALRSDRKPALSMLDHGSRRTPSSDESKDFVKTTQTCLDRFQGYTVDEHLELDSNKGFFLDDTDVPSHQFESRSDLPNQELNLPIHTSSLLGHQTPSRSQEADASPSSTPRHLPTSDTALSEDGAYVDEFIKTQEPTPQKTSFFQRLRHFKRRRGESIKSQVTSPPQRDRASDDNSNDDALLAPPNPEQNLSPPPRYRGFSDHNHESARAKSSNKVRFKTVLTTKRSDSESTSNPLSSLEDSSNFGKETHQRHLTPYPEDIASGAKTKAAEGVEEDRVTTSSHSNPSTIDLGPPLIPVRGTPLRLQDHSLGGYEEEGGSEAAGPSQ